MSPHATPRPDEAQDRVAIRFRGVSKIYPNGNVALKDVSFDVRLGSIHAVCGENGAGKSTLMKVLFGATAPTAGIVSVEGAPQLAGRGRRRDREAIGMVNQHFSLVPTLTVTENVFLGRELRRGVFTDRAEARRRVMQLSERYQLAVHPDVSVESLSIAAQQKVEILKALAREPRILILDEPTAVLSPPEIQELFARLRQLRRQGMTILFISHKLNEVRSLAEVVTVLRGGRCVGTSRLSEVPDGEIVRMVMGRDVATARRSPGAFEDEALLVLSDVSVAGRGLGERIEGVSMRLRPGEIVGVAGIEGSGQDGLLAVLSGRTSPTAGQVTFRGRDMGRADRALWRAAGLGYLPADRFRQGGAPGLSISDNAIAGTDGDGALQRGPFLRRRAIRQCVRGMIARYSVRAFGLGERLDSLSGGNAQKLIAARELGTSPSFLIADQPTRGIDVAAAAFLHGQILQMSERGAAVLLVSADLDELLRLSDRVIVMHGGRVVADLPNGRHLTPDVLGPYMLGTAVAA